MLIRPHAVLDVPVQKPQVAFPHGVGRQAHSYIVQVEAVHRGNVGIFAGKVQESAVGSVCCRDGDRMPGFGFQRRGGNAYFRLVNGNLGCIAHVSNGGSCIFAVNLHGLYVSGIDQLEEKVVAGAVLETEFEFY